VKVLLCYPNRDDTYRKVGFVLPPMGLGYIAAVLKNNGHQVEIMDFNINKTTPDYSQYDVVGISCDTSRFEAGVEIARNVKNKGSSVVMGGPHVSFNDDEALGTGLCDYVVRGEAEETFLDLINKLEKKADVGDVKGISFLADGKVLRTPDAPPPDVKTLPRPARDLLNIKAYQWLEMGGRKMTSIVTSRGCPYNCSFCSSSEFSGLKWRALEPADIVDEIEEIVNVYGFDGIAFLDDNFTMKADRVNEICDRIVSRGLDIYSWCFKITPDMAKEAVKMLKGHGISTHASFIIGDISETEEMVMDTINYAKEIGPEAVQFSILTPYPGTQLFEEVKDRIFTYDWNMYDCLHPVFKLDSMSSRKIESLLKRAYLSFYLSPRRIYNGLFSTIRGKGIKLSSIMRIFRGLN
jgi:anaerobic magnesium-protoporphyrin IX monomethyl ester cyclase